MGSGTREALSQHPLLSSHHAVPIFMNINVHKFHGCHSRCFCTLPQSPSSRTELFGVARGLI